MNENGYVISIAGSSMVIFSKYQKQALINQAYNREWALLIKSIGTTRCQLLLFIFWKVKGGRTIGILMILNKMLVFH